MVTLGETKELVEEDFNTAKKVEENIGKSLMDMDGFAGNLFNTIPSVSSEMLYRMQLDTNAKIYTLLMVIGILLILAVILVVTV